MLKPKACVQHCLNISSHRPCFLSTESLFSCRKLLVLLLGRRMIIERDRQKVPAQHKQGCCKLPGSQSRVGMRFPLVQHPGTRCRCKERWKRQLKSSAFCSLFHLCWCGSSGIGPPWEFKNSFLRKKESAGSGELWKWKRGAESSWDQPHHPDVLK